MGVKGLISFLNRRMKKSSFSTQPYLENLPILSGSKLCVDAFGFLFWIIDNDRKNQFGREFGGSYEDLHSMVMFKINLFQLCGINLIFFFDGQESIEFKTFTLHERALKQNNDWIEMAMKLQSSQAISHDDRLTFPLPPFTIQQFRMSLQQIAESSGNIEIIQCKSEADQSIALRCEQENRLLYQETIDGSPRPCCLVLGRDSDFLLMKGSPYLSFDDLLFITPENQVFDSLTVSLVPSVLRTEARCVWERSRVAQFLGFSEQQFVEWAILIGNDYTKGSHRSLFTFPELGINLSPEQDRVDIDEENERVSDNEEDLTHVEYSTLFSLFTRTSKGTTSTTYPALEALREAVIRSGPGFRASSRPPMENDSAEVREQLQELGLAIEFSRMLYELEDIHSYLDNLRSRGVFSREEEEEEEEEEDQRSISTHSDTMKLSCSDKTEFSSFLRNNILEIVEIPRLVITFLSQAITNPSRNSTSCLNLFQPTHIEALGQMLDEIEEFQNADLDLTSFQQSEIKPTWTDLCVAIYYQALCREVFDFQPNLSIHPYFLFNGFRYHNLMTNLNAFRTSPISPPLIAQTNDILPIDEHRENILTTIRENRITIIQGETGCGKSSKLPLMLFEDQQHRRKECRIFIAQPRRIAVHGILKRLRPILGKKVGMRMGNQEFDEYPETQLFFVTTGYLVKLLAFHPELLSRYTHIIIDEVHERSLDGDLICWLCRNLLPEYDFKLILMSATITTELYQHYFSLSDCISNIPSIFVGARRFPIQSYFVEDLINTFPDPASKRILFDVTEQAKTLNPTIDISSRFLSSQYKAVAILIRSKVPLGAAVLVFVAGISDIAEISTFFENSPQYHVCPIHSDIPIEEQLKIFEQTQSNQVKVIIATNAAESSLTLPDVDYVIDLGSEKAMKYQQKFHIVKLTRSLISKASSIQRAGRTGRVRPGTVYRLYSQSTFDQMFEHQSAEVKRTTLEDVVLWLINVLGSTPSFRGVRPVLQEMIEPPDLENMTASLARLYSMGMVDDPRDGIARLTQHGLLASGLPVDLSLSRLIIFGIQLGLLKESVIIAAGLSLTSSLFEIPNPIYHSDPNMYNDVVYRVFKGQTTLDQGIYSSPIIYLSLFLKFVAIKRLSFSSEFFHDFGIRRSQMKLFVQTCESIFRHVKQFISLKSSLNKRFQATVRQPKPKEDDSLSLICPLTPAKVNRLRLILAWAGENNILRQTVRLKKVGTASKILQVTSGEATTDQLDHLFPPSLEWKLTNNMIDVFDIPFVPISSPDRPTIENYSNLLSQIPEYHQLLLTWIIFDHQPPNVGTSQTGYLLLLLRHDLLRQIELLKSTTIHLPPSNQVDWAAHSLFRILKLESISSLVPYLDLFSLFSPNFTTFGPFPISKSQLNQLSSLKDKLDIFVALRFHSGEHSKLFLKNFPLSLDSIQSFATAELIRCETSTNRDLSSLRLSKQSISRNQSIEFDSMVPDDMIRGEPLGTRLLINYCSGYRDQSMKIVSRLDGSTSNLKFGFSSVKWNLISKHMDTQEFQEESASESSDFQCVHSFCSTHAFIDKYTVQASSIHFPESDHDTLFGTCFSVKYLQGGVVASAVTFFPPGSRWISLAYLCFGVDLISEPSYHISFQEGLPEEIQLNFRKPDQDDRERCSNIHDLLSSSSILVPNQDLISGIDSLFVSWDSPNNSIYPIFSEHESKFASQDQKEKPIDQSISQNPPLSPKQNPTTSKKNSKLTPSRVILKRIGSNPNESTPSTPTPTIQVPQHPQKKPSLPLPSRKNPKESRCQQIFNICEKLWEKEPKKLKSQAMSLLRSKSIISSELPKQIRTAIKKELEKIPGVSIHDLCIHFNDQRTPPIPPQFPPSPCPSSIPFPTELLDPSST